jgi:hypothetical protein
MRKITIALFLILFGIHGGAVADGPKYKVRVTIDKHADFSRLKTYTWEPGWDSTYRALNEFIESAVERELTALGLTKGAPGASDVTVTFATLRRTDTDLDSKPSPEGYYRTYPVGTLLILIRDSRTNGELFRARTDTPIDLNPETYEATINNQVARIFAKYPR